MLIMDVLPRMFQIRYSASSVKDTGYPMVEEGDFRNEGVTTGER